MKSLSPLVLAATTLGLSMPAVGQDLSATATYETVTLQTGFTPDPYEVSVISGGEVDASDLGDTCDGFIADAPDVKLHYETGKGSDFPLYIYAVSASDTTLVVNGPDGSWYCDDDSGGDADPMVWFQDPQSGDYDIWLGSYEEGDNEDATLFISEISEDD
ncbi:MAG: hypothetical protein B7Z08_05585 [Sphingomonadales bacterium 32-68-7]|nr:MAG: hypothetical protein B7Z33_03690 [Sphingomonadales bacterium 12-68-11]OYX09386.1 MAG: hypothetical protein B7Z08_05585 [Sphingomonadales bacterium 32-68-7]